MREGEKVGHEKGGLFPLKFATFQWGLGSGCWRRIIQGPCICEVREVLLQAWMLTVHFHVQGANCGSSDQDFLKFEVHHVILADFLSLEKISAQILNLTW